jgi:hypothetical protein
MPVLLRRFTWALLLLVAGNIVRAQNASYIVKTFLYEGSYVEEGGNGVMVQDTEGRLYMGLSNGVHMFDGEKTVLLKTPAPVFSLAFDKEKNRIYLGSNRQLGYLQRDETGRYHYTELVGLLKKNERDFERIEDIYVFKDEVLFYSPDGLLRYIPEKNIITLALYPDGEQLLHGSWQHQDVVLINSERGIQSYRSGKISRVVEGAQNPLQNREITFGVAYDEKRTLVCSETNKLFLFDGAVFRPYAEQLPAFDFNNAAVTADGRVILSTPYSGCLLLAKADGRVLGDLNTLNGLPENDCHGIYLDANQKLWVAHNTYFSAAYVGLPLATFPEFRSRINDVAYAFGRLYVATDDGLYYLPVENKNDYILAQRTVESVRTYQASEDELADEAAPAETATVTADDAKLDAAADSKKEQRKKKREERKKAKEEKRKQEETKKTSLFSFLNKKPVTPKMLTVRERYQTIEKTVAASGGAGDVFLRVPDLPVDKYYSILPIDGQLLVGAANGYHNVLERSVTKGGNLYARKLLASKKMSGYVFVAQERGLATLVKQKGAWVPGPVVKNVNGVINALYEDADGTLFAATREPGVLRIGIANGLANAQVARVYIPDSNNKHAVRLFTAKGRVYAYTDGKTYQPVPGKEAFEEAKDLSAVSQGQPLRTTQAGAQEFWLAGNRLYRTNGTAVQDSSWMLRMAPDITTLAPGNNGALFLVSNKSLYRLAAAQQVPTTRQENFKAYFSRIIVNSDSTALPVFRDSSMALNSFLLPYNNAYDIRAEFAAPSYPGVAYYLYQVNDKSWLQADGNKVMFSQLKPGRYKLKVVAVDYWGNRSEAAVLRFTLEDSFWHSTLFSVLELVAALGLLTGIFWVRRSVRKTPDARSARQLASVLIVLTFSTIDFTFDKQLNNFNLNNPLIDFTIKIVTAFLLVPLQERLESFIFNRSKERSAAAGGDPDGGAGTTPAPAFVKS